MTDIDDLTAAVEALLAAAKQAQRHIDADTDEAVFCVVPNREVLPLLDAARAVATAATKVALVADEPAEPPFVRGFADLSVHHLPRKLWDNLGNYGGVRAYDTESGWLVYVPDDPREHVEAERQAGRESGFAVEVPDEIVPIWEFARSRGCDYILFDLDGEVVDDLPTWDW